MQFSLTEAYMKKRLKCDLEASESKRLGTVVLEDLENGEQNVQDGLFLMVRFGHF